MFSLAHAGQHFFPSRRARLSCPGGHVFPSQESMSHDFHTSKYASLHCSSAPRVQSYGVIQDRLGLEGCPSHVKGVRHVTQTPQRRPAALHGAVGARAQCQGSMVLNPQIKTEHKSLRAQYLTAAAVGGGFGRRSRRRLSVPQPQQSAAAQCAAAALVWPW